MVWGQKRGVADLVDRLQRNDPTLASLYVLSVRKFDGPEIKTFCEALKSNNTVRELYASGHKIDSTGAKFFGDALKENSTVQKVCIGDQSFGDDGVEALCKGLVSNASVTDLDLEYKTVGDLGAVALGDYLASNTVLSRLALGRNQLGNTAVASIMAGLQSNVASALTSLDLSANLFGAAGCVSLSTWLSSSGCRLTELSLKQNPLTDVGGMAVISALHDNATVTTVRLTECELGDMTAIELGRVLTNNRTLREVDLEGNSVGPEGVSGLCEGLTSAACSISSLLLKSNKIGAEGALALSRALTQRAAADKAEGVVDVTTLDVGNNDVGVEAAVALLTTPGLEELRLFGNTFGDEGMARIASAFLPVPTPDTETPPPPPSAGSGSDAAPTPSSGGAAATRGVEVSSLDLCGVGMTGPGCCALLQALARGGNTRLRLLLLGGNDLKGGGEEAIVEHMEAFPHLDIARDKPDCRQEEDQAN